MEHPWPTSYRAFADAATWFVSTAGLVDDAWSRPGLGEWDVRSLVGHTSRSLLTVETYLARPADTVEVESAVAYYDATRLIARGPDVAARGRDAGDALGSDPAAAVAEIAARALPLVADCDGTEVIATIAGGMRLRDYLPTRTFELVVHTADLAAALDLPLAVPTSAAAEALDLVTRLTIDAGRAGQLLLATTGRRALPDGFSVL
jgi:uncharacterized protein (TIGR03083 family)